MSDAKEPSPFWVSTVEFDGYVRGPHGAVCYVPNWGCSDEARADGKAIATLPKFIHAAKFARGMLRDNSTINGAQLTSFLALLDHALKEAGIE